MSTGIAELAQLHRNGPEIEPCGDCYRTALACLLGADHPTDIPHFVNISISNFGKRGSPPEYMWTRQWLRETHGKDLFFTHLDEIEQMAEANDVDMFGLATIPGFNAKWHCVVWDVRNERVHWDPYKLTGYNLDKSLISNQAIEVITTPYDPAPELMDRHPWQLPGEPIEDCLVYFRPWEPTA